MACSTDSSNVHPRRNSSPVATSSETLIPKGRISFCPLTFIQLDMTTSCLVVFRSGWYDPCWPWCHQGKWAGVECRVEAEILSLNPAGLMKIRVAYDIPARHGTDGQQFHAFAFLDVALKVIGSPGSEPAGSQVCDHGLLGGSTCNGRGWKWGWCRSGCR